MELDFVHELMRELSVEELVTLSSSNKNLRTWLEDNLLFVAKHYNLPPANSVSELLAMTWWSANDMLIYCIVNDLDYLIDHVLSREPSNTVRAMGKVTIHMDSDIIWKLIEIDKSNDLFDRFYGKSTKRGEVIDVEPDKDVLDKFNEVIYRYAYAYDKQDVITWLDDLGYVK